MRKYKIAKSQIFTLSLDPRKIKGKEKEAHKKKIKDYLLLKSESFGLITK